MGVFTGSRRQEGRADVEEILSVSWVEQVRELVQLGCLVSTGTTRDGGAVVLTVTYAGEWNKDYVRDEVGGLDFLAQCATDVKAAAESGSPVRGGTTRARRGGAQGHA